MSTWKERHRNKMIENYAKKRLNNIMQLQLDLIKILIETDFENSEHISKDLVKSMRNLYILLENNQSESGSIIVTDPDLSYSDKSN